jgi:hypothetical protein
MSKKLKKEIENLAEIVRRHSEGISIVTMSCRMIRTEIFLYILRSPLL